MMRMHVFANLCNQCNQLLQPSGHDSEDYPRRNYTATHILLKPSVDSGPILRSGIHRDENGHALATVTGGDCVRH